MEKYFRLTDNKGIEFEADFNREDILRNLLWVNAHISLKEDHGGFGFTINILGARLSIDFVDNRHWNHDANRWYKDGEEAEEYEKNKEERASCSIYLEREDLESIQNQIKAEWGMKPTLKYLAELLEDDEDMFAFVKAFRPVAKEVKLIVDAIADDCVGSPWPYYGCPIEEEQEFHKILAESLKDPDKFVQV